MDPTTFLLPMALKGLALASLVVAACSALRRARGAVVHAALAALFGALVALPLLQVAGPAWTVRVSTEQLGARAAATSGAAGSRVRHTRPEDQASTAVSALPFQSEPTAGAQAPRTAYGTAILTPSPVSTGPSVYERARARASHLASSGWLLVFAWGAGVLLVALYWTLALASAAQLVRAAQPVTDADWLGALARAQRSLGHTRAVRLLRSSRVSTPFAWGFGRPAVVLPPSSGTWDEDARAAVLEHEVAHLARRDPQVQILAQAALALHWFNPFAWTAYRRLLLAREQACDDAALAAGVAPSAYAALLLGVARLAQAPAARHMQERMALSAVSSMARPSDLERRIVSVLSPNLRRGAGSRRVRIALGIGVLGALLPLAALRPVAGAAATTTAMPDAGRASAVAQAGAPTSSGVPSLATSDPAQTVRVALSTSNVPRLPSPPALAETSPPVPPIPPVPPSPEPQFADPRSPTRQRVETANSFETGLRDAPQVKPVLAEPPAEGSVGGVNWNEVTAARLAAEAALRQRLD